MKRYLCIVPALATAVLLVANVATQAVPSTLPGVVDVTPAAGTTILEAVFGPGDNIQGNGTFSTTDDDTGFLISFIEGHELTFNLATEHDGSSLGGALINDSNKVAGSIAAGTKVNVYVIRLDPSDDDANNIEATIKFAGKILGLNGGQDIGHDDYLNEFTMGAVTTFNSGGTNFNFDFGGADNILSIDTHSRTLTFESGQGGAGLDTLWIITAIVPEPATATLGLIGVAGMLLRRRRVA